MMSTGDVPGCLRKLETLLRTIRFPGRVDYSGLRAGEPSAFLPIVSYTLTSFSPAFAEQLLASGLELTGKSDLRFTETCYKVLREIFSYRAALSTQQFLQTGFSQRKLTIVCDIITMVLERHRQLRKPRVRVRAVNTDHRGKGSSPPTNMELGPVVMGTGPIVLSDIQNPAASPSKGLHEQAAAPSCPEPHSSHSPENGNLRLVTDVKGSKEQAPEEGRGSLGAEAQLQILLSALNKISLLEERLEVLERQSHTPKSDEAVVLVTREKWDNLTNRVLLLETKIELNKSLKDMKDHLEENHQRALVESCTT